MTAHPDELATLLEEGMVKVTAPTDDRETLAATSRIALGRPRCPDEFSGPDVN